MPTVVVKFKILRKSGSTTTATSVQVSRKPPSESEVMSALKRVHPNLEIVILDIK